MANIPISVACAVVSVHTRRYQDRHESAQSAIIWRGGPVLSRSSAAKPQLVANYTGGSVAVLPSAATAGSAWPRVIQHEGSSADKPCRRTPRIHQSGQDKFAFAADLGCDKLFVYRFDPIKGTLTPNDPPSVALPPGSGPGISFHPNGSLPTLSTRSLATLTVLAYDAEHGTMEAKQTISTLPEGAKEDFRPRKSSFIPREVSLRFNHGHNSISVFHRRSHRQAAQCRTRRRNQDPATSISILLGHFMLVANQDPAIA